MYDLYKEPQVLPSRFRGVLPMLRVRHDVSRYDVKSVSVPTAYTPKTAPSTSCTRQLTRISVSLPHAIMPMESTGAFTATTVAAGGRICRGNNATPVLLNTMAQKLAEFSPQSQFWTFYTTHRLHSTNKWALKHPKLRLVILAERAGPPGTYL